MSLIPFSSIVSISGNHEPLNRSAPNESLHDVRDVRDCDASVKKVIGFHQNRDAGGALIETARCAHARFEPGESTCGNLRFQGSIHFF
jgi:hypothetical protein